MSIEVIQPKDMKLGDLLELLITQIVLYQKNVDSLDGRGSPYSSEKKLQEFLLENYERNIKPLLNEINNRELVYKKK